MSKFHVLNNYSIFQKGSPYLEDANELIQLARESGFIDAEFKKHILHAKECLTHADVEKSHFGKETKVVFKLENIYGMIILLAVGLSGAIITLIGEIIIHKIVSKKDEVNSVIVI